MKNKFLIVFSLILLVNSSILAQDVDNLEQTAESILETKQNPRIYKNKFYKFEVTLPNNWIEISSDDSATLVEIGKETSPGITKTAKRQVEKATKKTTFLFHYAKYTVGSAANAGIICAIERTIPTKASSRLIALASQLNYKQNFGYKITKSTTREWLGGRSFYSFALNKMNRGVLVKQKIYISKLSNTKVMQFAMTYTNDEDLILMESIVNSLKFTK